MTTIISTIISKTNEKIPFDKSFSDTSNFISELMKESSETFEIKIDYNSDNIRKCIQFCKLYNANKFAITRVPIHSRHINRFLPKWCVDLFDQMDDNEISVLLDLANFLDIPILLEALCIKLRFLMLGKNPEEIRQMVGRPVHVPIH